MRQLGYDLYTGEYGVPLRVHKNQSSGTGASLCSSAATRHCHETTQIGQWTIPAGTQIQMDLESVHMNPEHWGPEDVTHCVPERCVLEAGVRSLTTGYAVGISLRPPPRQKK